MRPRTIAVCLAAVALACGSDAPEPAPEPPTTERSLPPPADPQAGCVTASCDDQNVCTADGCSPNGCVHTDVSARCPAPEDPCMAAVCDPARGCVAVKLGDGAPCGLADGCIPMLCQGGQCVLARGAPADCPQ